LLIRNDQVGPLGRIAPVMISMQAQIIANDTC
jgi:hypothetical protein